MKSILKLCLFLVCFCFLACSEDDPIDLSGEWLADGYECEIGSFNQIIEIVHDLTTNDIEATKITGDGCVTSGNITFFGTFDGTDSEFDVTFVTGSLSMPNSTSSNAIIEVENSNKLLANIEDVFFVTFTRN